MSIIKQNPFRVLGLLGDSTERELQRQIATIKRFTEVGKTKSFDYDFEFLGVVSRDIDDIQRAARTIEQAHKKLLYSLFWFVKNNQFDEIALNNLKDQNTDNAIYVWNKTLRSGITSKNYSSYHNLSTLYIALATGNGSLENQYLRKGIELKKELIHSECLLNFSELVTGNGVATESSDVSKLFADEIIELLSPHIGASEGISTHGLISLFSGFPDDIRKYVSSKYTELPLANIEKLVEKTTAKRKNNKSVAAEYGDQLFRLTHDDRTLLRSVLGVDDIEFQMAVNRVADEVMQCSIDYFNEWSDSDELDPGDLALKIAGYAKSIGPTGQSKNRIDENTETIKEWVDDKPEREKQRKTVKEVVFIATLVQKFPESPSVNTCSNLVVSCMPKLSIIRSAFGAENEFYLGVSSTVAVVALAGLVRFMNEQQEFVMRNSILLSVFVKNISAVISVIHVISKMDVTSDVRRTINTKTATILNILSQSETHTNSTTVPTRPKPKKQGSGAGWVIIAAIVGLVFIGIVSDDRSSTLGRTTYSSPPAPKVNYETYYVTAKKLNIRANPSADAAVVRQAPKFQTLRVFDVTNGWAKLRQADGTITYTAVRYLAKGDGHRAEMEHCQINSGSKPRNGEILARSLANGYHHIQITGSSQAIVVKLKSGGRDVLSFYVAPHQVARVQDVPDGTYTVYFASGGTWSRYCDRFVPEMQVSKDPEPVMMTGNASGTYYEMTSRIDGNFKPTSVADNDF